MRIGKKKIMGAAWIGLITVGVLWGSWWGREVRGSEPAVYVATNGSDSGGDGTEQRPFRSLSRAAETAVPGTTIFVRGGIYEAARKKSAPRVRPVSQLSSSRIREKRPFLTAVEPILAMLKASSRSANPATSSLKGLKFATPKHGG